MNRINPLYLALLLIVVLLLVIFKLDSAKVELADAQESFVETTTLATNLSGLKDAYGNQKKSKATILKILKNSSLKQAGIMKKVKKSGIVISSKSMDAKALNYLLGKLLNGAYNITSLDVKKLSETKVSLHVEIKW